jgi:hypothetical protein
VCLLKRILEIDDNTGSHAVRVMRSFINMDGGWEQFDLAMIQCIKDLITFAINKFDLEVSQSSCFLVSLLLSFSSFLIVNILPFLSFVVF